MMKKTNMRKALRVGPDALIRNVQIFETRSVRFSMQCFRFSSLFKPYSFQTRKNQALKERFEEEENEPSLFCAVLCLQIIIPRSFS